MKSKVLQPRLFYPARLSIKIEGEIKIFPEKNVNAVHYHQTSIVTNVKQTALRRGIEV